MGFKSGEDGGYTMIFSFLMSNLARDCMVKWAACDGALSCINTIFRLMIR